MRALLAVGVIATLLFLFASVGSAETGPASQPSPPSSDAGPSTESATPESIDTSDAEAMKWWLSSGESALVRLDDRTDRLGLNRRIVYLVHLPSGRPAFPAPASVADGDIVQLVVIRDAEHPQALELQPPEGCSASDLAATTGTMRNGRESAAAGRAARFSLQPVGALLECSAHPLFTRTTHYSLNGASALRIRPQRYALLTWIIGYDYATDRTLDKVATSRSDAFIARTRSPSFGGTNYLGLTLPIMGTDFDRMHFLDAILNLVVAVDVDSEDFGEAFLIGGGLRASRGFSLVLGASVHRVRDTRGIHSGDAYPATDPPKGWFKGGVGFFLGIGIDDTLITGLIDRCGGVDR